MPLTREKQRYELLLRWKDDVLVGAHTVSLDIVKDGIEVLSEKQELASSLNPADIVTIYPYAQSMEDSSRLLKERVAADLELIEEKDECIRLQKQVDHLLAQMKACGLEPTPLPGPAPV